MTTMIKIRTGKKLIRSGESGGGVQFDAFRGGKQEGYTVHRGNRQAMCWLQEVASRQAMCWLQGVTGRQAMC